MVQATGSAGLGINAMTATVDITPTSFHFITILVITVVCSFLLGSEASAQTYPSQPYPQQSGYGNYPQNTASQQQYASQRQRIYFRLGGQHFPLTLQIPVGIGFDFLVRQRFVIQIDVNVGLFIHARLTQARHPVLYFAPQLGLSWIGYSHDESGVPAETEDDVGTVYSELYFSPGLRFGWAARMFEFYVVSQFLVGANQDGYFSVGIQSGVGAMTLFGILGLELRHQWRSISDLTSMHGVRILLVFDILRSLRLGHGV